MVPGNVGGDREVSDRLKVISHFTYYRGVKETSAVRRNKQVEIQSIVTVQVSPN